MATRRSRCASGFEDSAVRSVDSYLDGGQINDYEVGLIRPTILATALTSVDADAFSAMQRARIEWEFDELERLAAEPRGRPRFVFAHVPSPHRPWVVDASGQAITEADLETWYFGPDFPRGLSAREISDRFGGQVRYVGGRTLQAIDMILVASDEPPIIIVTSDHGASVPDTGSGTLLRNLFAAKTPDRTDLFADNVTLVNVFPTLFDAYLDVALPRSDETSFVAGPNGLFDPVPVVP